MDNDSVLLGSFTRSGDVFYPTDSNTFNNITLPSTGAGLRIYLEVDDDENDLFWMERFKTLNAPTNLDAVLAHYDTIDLTWDNSVTGGSATTKILVAVGAGSYSLLTTAGTGVDSYSHAPLLFDTEYHYRLLHRYQDIGTSTRDVLGDTTSAESVRTPRELWVRIKGPGQVRPNQECTWVLARGGGVGPFAYQWYKNGSPDGTGEEWIGSDTDDFTLRVVVTSDDEQIDDDSHSVIVTPTAPPFRLE